MKCAALLRTAVRSRGQRTALSSRSKLAFRRASLTFAAGRPDINRRGIQPVPFACAAFHLSGCTGRIVDGLCVDGARVPSRLRGCYRRSERGR
jgi:hypothetical protein